MPSHRIRAQPARLLRTKEAWRELLISIAPIAEFRQSREQVLDLFAATYSEVDEVQNAFSNYSNPDLRDWAIRPRPKLLEYNPHERVTNLFSFMNRLAKVVKHLLLIAATVGVVFSLQRVVSLAIDGLELFEPIGGVVPIPLIGGIILYLWLLRADTFVHQTLADELSVGAAEVTKHRRRPRIVSCGIWNRSLRGQAGLLLVAFFFVLNALPRLPLLGRRFDNPDLYVKGIITNNVNLFYEAESTRQAVRRLYRRLR